MLFFAAAVVALLAGCDGATLDATSMVNSSALYGSTTTFSCLIVGTQGVGETLSFTKVVNGVSTLISSDISVANGTKHSIAGTYVLTINDVVWTDEGQYTCQLGLIASSTAYLTVGVAPSEGWIYWGDNATSTKKNEKANLTCEASTARPPATFRWFVVKSDDDDDDDDTSATPVEITSGILTPTPTLDTSGYGIGKSMIEMTPLDADVGNVYTCHIDAAGKDSVFIKTLTYSGAGTVLGSVCLIIAAVVTSLRV